MDIRGTVGGSLDGHEVELAIGIFDGVHIGHRAVLGSALAASAGRAGALAVVLTFAPHPSKVLRPEQGTQLLLPLEANIARLEAAGVDAVWVQAFDRGMAALEAEAFGEWLKARVPRLTGVHVGANFRFGRGRSGGGAELAAQGRELGFAVHLVEQERLDGEVVSSSRIRTLLQGGEIAAVNACLGWRYGFLGRVQPGQQLGRKLGYPTLNLAWEPETQPRYGVYLLQVREAGALDWRPAVANYGMRPTVEAGAVAPVLEAHLLDAGARIDYGATVEVEFLEFLRPEQKFADTVALVRQIGEDCERARQRWMEITRQL